VDAKEEVQLFVRGSTAILAAAQLDLRMWEDSLGADSAVSLNAELDNNSKIDAWNEVLLKAKSLEVVSDQRDWTYVRDKIWGHWKSRVLVSVLI